MAQQPIIAIVGPTGSGKTSLAVALARDLSLRGVPTCRDDEAIPSGSRPRLRGDRSAPRDDMLFELVSADSRQVYRGMDIGTGKERLPDVPQHLIDIVDPDEDFTLADFLMRAKQVIADIHARGRVPIVVGGTGLYVQALIENWDIPSVKPNPALRAELEKKSVEKLQEELAAIDPEEADRLGAGKRYLVRALEMWHATGRKPSELKKKNEPLYDVLVIGIDIPREELYRRIDARVDDMFARGFVDEVRGLLKKYPPHLSTFDTIGYREVMDKIAARSRRGALSETSRVPKRAWCPDSERSERIGTSDARAERTAALAAVSVLSEWAPAEGTAPDPIIDRIKHHTHAYARRQLTWLRRMKYVEWIRDTKDALSRITSFLNN